ncbi:MAG: DUF418 domain-containing protein [Ferruginibacter sp.]
MITELPEKNIPGDDLKAAAVQPFSNGPVARLQSLDTLRGIGLLGGLFISIWIFGGFSANQQNGLLLQSKGINYRLWGTIELFFDGKMRALVSLVFGAAMILSLTNKQYANKMPGSDRFIRRQMWLMAFGLVNAWIFLWPGDLLFHLGIIGIFLFPFVRLKARSLLIAAIVTTLIFSAKNYWNYADDRNAYAKYITVTGVEKRISKDSLSAAKNGIPARDQKKDSLSRQQKEDKSAWEGIVSGKKYDPKKNDEGYKDMRSGSFGKIWNYLLPSVQNNEAQWTYQTGLWDLSGMILLGMALFKFGFFDSSFASRKYLLLTLAGLAAGLLLGWFRLQYNQYALQDYTRFTSRHRIPFDLFFPIERAMLALGYAGLALLLMRAGILKFLWKVFAAVGQMALSNYLLQSVLCSIFFTGFGMGYFGRLQQYQLYAIVVEMSVIQIVFSILWLRYYYYGPAEWLLKCLVFKKWLSNKKFQTEVATPSTILS